GHSVIVAGNGREALTFLENQPFDMVLLDVQMPEMYGFQATAASRDKEKRSGVRIPIIAMTAHAMTGDRERCIDAGMDDYISKPIDPRVLFALVEVGEAKRRNAPAAAVATERLGQIFNQKTTVGPDARRAFITACPPGVA